MSDNMPNTDDGIDAVESALVVSTINQCLSTSNRRPGLLRTIQAAVAAMQDEGFYLHPMDPPAPNETFYPADPEDDDAESQPPAVAEASPAGGAATPPATPPPDGEGEAGDAAVEEAADEFETAEETTNRLLATAAKGECFQDITDGTWWHVFDGKQTMNKVMKMYYPRKTLDEWKLLNQDVLEDWASKHPLKGTSKLEALSTLRIPGL